MIEHHITITPTQLVPRSILRMAGLGLQSETWFSRMFFNQEVPAGVGSRVIGAFGIVDVESEEGNIRPDLTAEDWPVTWSAQPASFRNAIPRRLNRRHQGIGI